MARSIAVGKTSSRWGRGLSGPFERRIVRERVESLGCEDGFGLGVSVGLPGEHAQLVGGEPEVVEPFAGRWSSMTRLADSADARSGRWMSMNTSSSSGKARGWRDERPLLMDHRVPTGRVDQVPRAVLPQAVGVAGFDRAITLDPDGEGVLIVVSRVTRLARPRPGSATTTASRRPEHRRTRTRRAASRRSIPSRSTRGRRRHPLDAGRWPHRSS
jgi:hypothetical protein